MQDGDDYRSKSRYAPTEVENTRKRWEGRTGEVTSDLKRCLLGQFPPILDSLDQALRYDDAERVRAGLDATLRASQSLLAKNRERPSVTTDRHFDSRLAGAIAALPIEGVDDEIAVRRRTVRVPRQRRGAPARARHRREAAVVSPRPRPRTMDVFRLFGLLCSSRRGRG